MRKRNILYVIIILLVVVQVSCSIPVNHPNEQLPKATKDDSKKNCPTISPETAILIAKGYMFLDYDLRTYEPKAEAETELWKEYGDTWKITFKSLSKDNFGEPIVWVFKGSGEVLTVKHAK